MEKCFQIISNILYIEISVLTVNYFTQVIVPLKIIRLIKNAIPRYELILKSSNHPLLNLGFSELQINDVTLKKKCIFNNKQNALLSIFSAYNDSEYLNFHFEKCM